MAKIRVRIEGQIPRDQAEEIIEIPDDEWAAMTERQREARMNEEYDNLVQQFVSGSVEVVKEG